MNAYICEAICDGSVDGVCDIHPTAGSCHTYRILEKLIGAECALSKQKERDRIMLNMTKAKFPINEIDGLIELLSDVSK